MYGRPRPAGSKHAFVHPHTKKIIVRDASGPEGRIWRSQVQAAALPFFPRPLGGAFAVEIEFRRVRPKGHMGTGRNAGIVKDSAPAFPTTVPDIDKLSRSVLDGLSGVVWRDDAQVVAKLVRKVYAEHEGARIRLWLADAQTAADLALGDRLPFELAA